MLLIDSASALYFVTRVFSQLAEDDRKVFLNRKVLSAKF
jgi:hypothetical protein